MRLGGRGSRRGDRSLGIALKRGEPGALEAIQAEYGPVLLGFLTSVLGDRATAEDVFQVTLLDIWRRAPTYDPRRGSVLTWTMTIARSRAIDQMRQRIPEPRDPHSSDAPSPLPDSQLDAVIEQWRIAELMRQLPSFEADLLRLRFYEGLSQPEIAQRTGIPLGTVKMRMVQALGRLRDLIDSEERLP